MYLTNNSICKILLLLIIYTSYSFSQDTVKILICNFKSLNTDVKQLDSFEIEIPNLFKTQFNQSKEANFLAISGSDNSNDSITTRMINYNNIQNIIDHLGNKFNYIIFGNFSYDKNLKKIIVGINLVSSKTGIIEFNIEEEEGVELTDSNLYEKRKEVIKNDLAQKLYNRIENFITSRVRIGILEFKMTGGDSTLKYFEYSLPTMLTSSLSRSSGFKMVEIKFDPNKEKMVYKGIINPDYVLKKGLGSNVNYLIMGEFFEHHSEFRIDIRCVNIETLEILLSDGINIKQIEMSELTDAINRLASNISRIVKNDFSKRETPLKSLAVICLSPIPTNRNTKIKSENIQRDIVRKLRYVEGLVLKNDPNQVTAYIEKEEDNFKICSNLGVNNLLTLRYQEFDDNTDIIDVDLYSLERPTLELFRMSKKIDEDMNQFINNVVDSSMSTLNLKIPVKDSTSWKEIKLPKYLTRWTIGFKASNVHRADPQVYLGAGLGNFGEVFLTYHTDDPWESCRYEFSIGYDLGKTSKTITGEEIKVRSLQAGATAQDEIRLSNSPIWIYPGLGVMAFWTYRRFYSNQGTTEEYGDFNIGVSTMLGLELKMDQIGISIFFEPRYVFSLTNIEAAETSSGYVFPGGKVGGLYLLIGLGYNFNWPNL